MRQYQRIAVKPKENYGTTQTNSNIKAIFCVSLGHVKTTCRRFQQDQLFVSVLRLSPLEGQLGEKASRVVRVYYSSLPPEGGGSSATVDTIIDENCQYEYESVNYRSPQHTPRSSHKISSHPARCPLQRPLPTLNFCSSVGTPVVIFSSGTATVLSCGRHGRD